MIAGAFAVLLASAPLLPKVALLRPRYGSFPLLMAVLCLLWIGLMRWALPGFRKRETRVALVLGVLLILSWLPRTAARTWGARWLTPTYYSYVIVPTTAVQVAMLVGLLTAPVWVPLGRWARRRPEHEQPDSSAPVAPAPPSPALIVEPTAPEIVPARSALLSRRRLLTLAPWVLPGGALVGASYGSFIESRRIVIKRVRVPVPNLPPALNGFRIGQITDLHIARDLTQLAHLERGLGLLAEERLDILCATGDLCDEPKLFATTLRMIAQVPVRLGHYGCLGNHELFLGLDIVRRAYDRSPVQLLEDESVRLGGLRLAGIGYAIRGRSPRLSLEDVPAQLDEALAARHRDEPTATVMMAHHPHAFTQLGDRRIDLMLSGHTHGGQLGFRDGSAIELLYPYARGLYGRRPDRSASPEIVQPPPSAQLFVSSGLGHWLPVRLNCPPEVVVIELVSA